MYSCARLSTDPHYAKLTVAR
uniref:Uncharacterized protein n=1 Tax=Anguilla anguilla TaxID=7936 RepID=A0A0E9UF83_ANGAN